MKLKTIVLFFDVILSITDNHEFIYIQHLCAKFSKMILNIYIIQWW